ncbi:hypothetical protein [Flavobacterium sp. '19STA2R22 D10 B1']|uniref:hypothetical protein n=1 Tax=Flavobacterium aerium TaxID=3037261 RepID=UPI00278BC0F1|nr:hypothetical protein [Flavobacterium sp. '19STA2R22 D10 B1']
MYNTVKEIHSGWAYLVLIMLVIAFVNALIGLTSKKTFVKKDFMLSLFALIFTHIQLVIGAIMYFTSPYLTAAKEMGMGGTMKDSTLRLYVLEHPLMMLIAIVLITMGWSKHKKETTDHAKFKKITVFYGIALLFVLSRIPWNVWLKL